MTVVAPVDGPLFNRCRAAGIGTVTVPYPSAMAAFETGAGNSGAGHFGPVRAAVQLLWTAAVTLPYLRRLRAAPSP